MFKLRDPISSLFAFATAIVLTFVCARWSNASESFSHPIFTPDRHFLLDTPQDTTQVPASSFPLEIRAFDAAVKSCDLNLEDVQQKFSKMLDPTSPLWKTLNLIFPGSLERVRSRKIHVLIDDFSQFSGKSPEFASYFIHDGAGPIIGLDCSSTVARFYWLYSLVHELTHALLDGEGAESWWEEAVAQLLERELGGAQPDLTVKHLENAAQIPPLLELRRPLPSRESYAMNYLFATYIKAMFSGWQTLSAMTLAGARNSDCENQSDFLTKIACRGQIQLGGAGKNQNKLGNDKMTRNGLLRYFYVSITMKSAVTDKYKIAGWNGFSAFPGQTLPRILLSGQATVSNSSGAAEKMPRLDPDLEIYRILIDQSGHFQILTRDQIGEFPTGFQASQDFILVLNLTSNALTIAN